jgi:hypothetical protein
MLICACSVCIAHVADIADCSDMWHVDAYQWITNACSVPVQSNAQLYTMLMVLTSHHGHKAAAILFRATTDIDSVQNGSVQNGTKQGQEITFTMTASTPTQGTEHSVQQQAQPAAQHTNTPALKHNMALAAKSSNLLTNVSNRFGSPCTWLIVAVHNTAKQHHSASCVWRGSVTTGN